MAKPANFKIMKASAVARPNFALVKYWGKIDSGLNLPLNNSIGITQEGLETKTTVEFSQEFRKDEITIDGVLLEKGKSKEIIEHLSRIRDFANISAKAKVVSKNNFPSSAGLASSASGFAALSCAGAKAADLELTKRELSILARKGSGSACRSIFGGFVEWVAGNSDKTSYSYQIAPPEHMDIKLLVVYQHQLKFTSSRYKISTSPFINLKLSLFIILDLNTS